MTPTQPRTKAGKALTRDLWGAYAPRVESDQLGSVSKRIIAIEEEAVSEYREALKDLVEAVEGLDRKRAFETLSQYGQAIKAARSLLDRSGVTE